MEGTQLRDDIYIRDEAFGVNVFLAHSFYVRKAMNFSNHTFQQEFTQFKDIPSRLKSDTDGRTSAQSPLAHSDEDWTLIADMTERRKIQNRIAQRNYRETIFDSTCLRNHQLTRPRSKNQGTSLSSRKTRFTGREVFQARKEASRPDRPISPLRFTSTANQS